MAQLTGEYVFNKHEMAAVFNFEPDNRFSFFYSYGAVDRIASGTFSVDGNVLKLKSSKEAGKDFRVVSQAKKEGGYMIKVEDDNRFLMADVCCIFVIGADSFEEFTDTNGVVKVDFPHCDKIYVRHTLYPDIVTLIKDGKNDNNRFKLAINPAIFQVSFKGIDFKIEDGKTISCMHNYFMMFDDIQFVRQ